MGGIIGALVVALLVGVFLLGANSNNPLPPPAGQAAPTFTPQVASDSGAPGGAVATPPAGATKGSPDNRPGTFVPEEGKDHVKEGTPITYKSYPPSSGTHYPSTGDYGFHDQEVPEGKLVHNLEHGAIVLYYKPGLPADVLQQLRDAYARFPPSKYGKVRLVITPYTKLQTTLAIAAWSHVQLFTQFDFQGLSAFYQANVDKGPEDVP